ncbi:MAG: DUF4215 domain-containing protein [Kofleriaceae bacterium]
MALLIRCAAIATIAIGVGCARFDPSETIQLVPSAELEAAEVETLRQAAACWNLRFGTRFEVVREPTSAQTVDVAYNPFACWAADGTYSFDQRAHIDVCPAEHSNEPDAVPRDLRLFMILAHELGHAAGIRIHSSDPYAVMGSFFGLPDHGFKEMFQDDDARLLREATGFVGAPDCEGQAVIRADPETGIACGCFFDSDVLQVDGGVAAYDAARGSMLVYDHTGKTWTWDGAVWTHLTPPVSPPPRGASAMAYDPVRERVVMFGGVMWLSTLGFGKLADTWEWDGATWVEVSPQSSPSAGSAQMMAYDPNRQRIVMFGGVDFKDEGSDEVWEYDGTTWTRGSPAQSPPGRYNGAFGFDPVRRTMVLFGGVDDEGVLSDQWEWDGTNWSTISLDVVPPPRYGAAAGPGVDGRLTIAGGYGPREEAYAMRDDLWEWDGTAWTAARYDFGPTARSGAAFGFDTARDRVVVIGNFYWLKNKEVWEWDGTSWFAAGYRECGNRVIEDNETCDDGNLARDDGCSEHCRLE